MLKTVMVQAALAALLLAAPASAADLGARSGGVVGERPLGGWGHGAPPAEQRIIPFTGNVPACDAPGVLSAITGQFDRREARFWNSGLRIAGIEHVRPVAFRPWGDSFIPRRHCTATAHVAEGPHLRQHRVNYVVREELGVLFGSSWEVDWCVVGIERHLHAAPHCAMMLP